MKKSVFLFSLLACAASINAQEVGQVDGNAAGFPSSIGDDAVDVTNVKLAESATSNIMTGSADKYKITTAHINNYRYVEFNNDTALVLKLSTAGNAVTGNTNGAKSGDYTGCQYLFTAGMDGYAYFVIKANASKNYFIKELDGDPAASTTQGYEMAYTFSMHTDTAFTGLFVDNELTYSLDSDEDGYFTGDAATEILTPADFYYGGADKTAEKVTEETAEGGILAANSKTKMDVNGVCVLSCKVLKDAQYLVYCTGSKMTIAGYAISNSPMSIRTYGFDTYDEDGNLTAAACSVALKSIEGEAAEAEEAAVAEVHVAAEQGAKMYNLAGQQVDENYKGVVIVNGKKYYNK